MSVQFDPIFAEGEKLSREQVARELVKRIPIQELRILAKTPAASGQWVANNRASKVVGVQKVTEIMLDLLEDVDDKYLTREFADHGDIRPLLQQYYLDESKDESRRNLAIALIPGQTERITKAANEIWPDENLSEEDAATKKAMVEAWRGGDVKSLNLEPRTLTDPSTGEVTIEAAEGSIGTGFMFEDPGNEGLLTSRRFISESDWRRLLRQGSEDLDSLLYQEELINADKSVEGGYVDPQTGMTVNIKNLGVQYDDTVVKPDNRGGLTQTAPGVMQQDFSIRNVRDEQNWYGVSQVLNKPYEMSKEEAIEVHRKMKAAGIFDIAGGEPMIPGDVSDPAFKAAWKLLITKSMSENKSMMSILEEQAGAREQALQAQLAVQLTDPARIKLNSNAMARSAIGRHLSEQEQAELLQFVHDLERKNARMSAGLEETADPEKDYSDVEGETEGTLYDIDAQIDQWFETNLGEETGARDLAESYQMFTGMLGGPGRGVG